MYENEYEYATGRRAPISARSITPRYEYNQMAARCDDGGGIMAARYALDDTACYNDCFILYYRRSISTSSRPFSLFPSSKNTSHHVISTLYMLLRYACAEVNV